jgi:two-component system NarL family response regulator
MNTTVDKVQDAAPHGTRPATTVIVEDERLVANMLEACLAQMPALRVVGTAHCGTSGVELCLKHKPDLVLLDIEMPGMSGLEVARQLRDRLPRTRIIVVSSHCEPYAIHQLTRLQIHGFVDKGSPLDSLRSAIQDVLAGKTAYCPAFAAASRNLLQHAEAYHKILSAREIAVLIAVAEGLGDSVIAARLDISPNTVSTHRRNIRCRLDAHNDRDLTNYARQWGLVPLTLGEIKNADHACGTN